MIDNEHCITDDGSRFIVEMQKAEQEYFKDRSLYESRKEYWDYTSTLQTAEKKGRAEGLAEGKREANESMARSMKADGMPIEVIAKYTGLSVSEIESL